MGRVGGPRDNISVAELKAAIAKMKDSKDAGLSEVVSEMLKASGGGAEWVADVCNAVVKDGKIPEDWSKNWLASVYREKGDALECGSYRRIKILKRVLEIIERIINVRVREKVEIDNIQFGFIGGKGTTHAIFIVRQLQKTYIVNKKGLWMAFVDLEKASDRVPGGR